MALNKEIILLAGLGKFKWSENAATCLGTQCFNFYTTPKSVGQTKFFPLQLNIRKDKWMNLIVNKFFLLRYWERSVD